MNSFHDDNNWQRGKRDAYLKGWYGKYSHDGRFIFLDKGRFAELVQKQLAADTIAQSVDGSVVSIEEKIVRWKGRKYKSICVETESCTVPGHESPGWGRYGNFDYLFYCMEMENGNLDARMIRGPELLTWFWPRENEFPKHTMDSQNKSRTRLVPVDMLQELGFVSYHRIIGLDGVVYNAEMENTNHE